MIQSTNTKSYDTVIIGGGVLGCWASRHAIANGHNTLLVEKHYVGAGASGGFLGALMPHMPDSWNAKKQLQYDGLVSLEEAAKQLEDETGIDCGYRRCGRLMPVTNEKLVSQIERRSQGAANYWGGRYSLSHESDVPGWFSSELATHGIQHDTLSARINPRQYMAALEASIRPKCEIVEGRAAVEIRSSGSGFDVIFEESSKVSAGCVIVANGYEAYHLLQPFMAELNGGKPIGRGVKGQAVLVEHMHEDMLPILYHDGTYIVPHAGNRVAIGSTSVNDWQGEEPNGFDESDLEFYEKALLMMPELINAPIVERWAGVRPRNTLEGRGTEPYFNAVPGHENLIALIGGFKITLGLAHIAAKGLL